VVVGVTALWVGDSFTRGEGADVPAAQTYPYLVSARLGWSCQVDAQNGTGFVNDGYLAGPGLAPLVDRLPDTARRVRADVVIVDAGRNDGPASERQLRAAITRYVGALREAYPQARLVVVLPTLLGPWQPPEYRHVARVLDEVGRASGAAVLDPSAVEGFGVPGIGGDLVCFDGFHPSAAGQAHYADVLTELLRPMSPGWTGPG
jgi:lysophospholipase L1-like esterase